MQKQLVPEDKLTALREVQFREDMLSGELHNAMLLANEDRNTGVFNFVFSETETEVSVSRHSINVFNTEQHPHEQKKVIISRLNSLGASYHQKLNMSSGPKTPKQGVFPAFQRTKYMSNYQVKTMLKIPDAKLYRSHRKIDIRAEFLEDDHLPRWKRPTPEKSLENELLDNYQNCLQNVNENLFGDLDKKKTSGSRCLETKRMKLSKSQSAARKPSKEFDLKQYLHSSRKSDTCESVEMPQMKVINPFGNQFEEDEPKVSREYSQYAANGVVDWERGATGRLAQDKESIYGESEYKNRIEQYNENALLHEGYLMNSVDECQSEKEDTPPEQTQTGDGQVSMNVSRDSKGEEMWEKTEELMMDTFKDFRITDIRDMYRLVESENEIGEPGQSSIQSTTKTLFKTPILPEEAAGLQLPLNSAECFSKMKERMQEAINVLGFDQKIIEISAENEEPVEGEEERKGESHLEEKWGLEEKSNSVENSDQGSVDSKGVSIKINPVLSVELDQEEIEKQDEPGGDLSEGEVESLQRTLNDLSDLKTNSESHYSKKYSIDKFIDQISLDQAKIGSNSTSKLTKYKSLTKKNNTLTQKARRTHKKITY